MTGLIVFAGLYPIPRRTDARRLLGAGLPLLVLAAPAGTITLVLVYRRIYSIARFFAGFTRSAVAAWGVEAPLDLVDHLTITAAGTDATLGGLLVVVGSPSSSCYPPWLSAAPDPIREVEPCLER